MPWSNGGVIGARNLPALNAASGVWRLSEIESARRGGVWPRPIIQPTDVSGLALWLDASDASTIGPSSAGPGTVANNGFVKYLGDKSGSGRHMIQSGADSASPTLLTNSLNSRSVLSFDGGDVLTVQSSLTLTAQSVFQVLYSSANTDFRRMFTQSDSTADFQTAGHYIPLLRSGTSTSVGAWAGGGHRAAVTLPNVTWSIYSAVHTGSLISNRMGNGAAATFAHTLNKTFSQMAIGGAFDNTGFTGRIAETLMYTRAVTDEERVALVTYLGAKWGIAV